MELRIEEITAMVQGSAEGVVPDLIITGVAGLPEAQSHDISFFANPRYADLLYTTRAGAVFIQTDFVVEKSLSCVIIRVEKPELAFARILQIIAREKKPARAGIDQHAIIHPSARLGNNVYVGPHTVIEENAVIEEDCQIYAGTYIGQGSSVGKGSLIHPGVTVLDHCRIGARCILQSGCVIGSDGYGFVTEKGCHIKIPQVGTVVIGDDVEIGANAAIDRGTTGSTVIGSGTKIDNLVHIAHNVRIGEHCLIIAQVGISGSTTIGNHVTLAGQSGVVGHITIGDRSVVGAQAGVIGSVPPDSIVSGYPARPHRESMKIQGYIQKLPELFAEIKKRNKKKKE